MRKIAISIIYAEREQQWLKELSIIRGGNAEEAILASGLLEQVPALAGVSIESLRIGNYAQPIQLDTLLNEGDRIEIYRPLNADPKEVRRQLALLGKTMGKKGADNPNTKQEG